MTREGLRVEAFVLESVNYGYLTQTGQLATIWGLLEKQPRPSARCQIRQACERLSRRGAIRFVGDWKHGRWQIGNGPAHPRIKPPPHLDSLVLELVTNGMRHKREMRKQLVRLGAAHPLRVGDSVDRSLQRLRKVGVLAYADASGWRRVS